MELPVEVIQLIYSTIIKYDNYTIKQLDQN
jgi:hypothetical protein